MDEDQSMLQNLHVISNLKTGQKLCTLSSVFTIRDHGVMGGLMRRWYGEDRQANVSRITDLYKMAFLRCRVYALTEDRQSDEYIRLLEIISHSLTGLSTLVQTYRDDVSFVSKIEVLLQSISVFLKQHSVVSENPVVTPSRTTSPFLTATAHVRASPTQAQSSIMNASMPPYIDLSDGHERNDVCDGEGGK